MLVLSRKLGEKIHIGNMITLTVVRIGPNTVRLGIDAPRDLNIIREELKGDTSGSDGTPTTPREQTDDVPDGKARG